MKYFLFLLIATTLVSCSVEKRFQKRIERAERKIEKLTIKYPQLLRLDTLRDTITLTIDEVRHDTAFIPSEGDTVFINKDRLRIKYVTRNDSVFIQGECKADTIYKTIEIPTEKIEITKQSNLEYLTEKLGKWIKWLIALIFVGMIIWFVIKKTPLGRIIKLFK